MKTIKDFEVTGSSRRCLILNIEGCPTFCSTSNYAYLCQHPDTKWEVIEHPAHEGVRHIGFGRQAETVYPATKWVQIYKPTLF